VVKLVFAPAIGIACCQALGWLCGVIAVLFAVLGARNWLVGDGLPPAQAFVFAAVFVAGAMACFWFARVIQRLARE
jgi:glutathione S-transferase